MASLGAFADLVPDAAEAADRLLPVVTGLETGGNRDPNNAVSKTGALGRNQIQPTTAQQYGADPARLNDPAYNDQTARTILADLASRYPGDDGAVLAGYNGGPGRAAAYVKAGDDPSVLPTETQGYLTKSGLVKTSAPAAPVDPALAALGIPEVQQLQPEPDEAGSFSDLVPDSSAPPAGGGSFADLVPPARGGGALANANAAETADAAYAAAHKGQPAPDMSMPAGKPDPAQQDPGRAAGWSPEQLEYADTHGITLSLAPPDGWATTLLKSVQNIPAAVKQGSGEALSGVSEALQALGTHDGAKPLPGLTQHAQLGKDIASKASAEIQANAPRVAAGSAKDIVSQGITGAATMAPLILTSAVTKSDAPLLGVFAAQGYGQGYDNAIKRGRTEEQAQQDGAFNAAATALPAELPLHAIMKPGQKFMSKVATSAFGAAAANGLTTALQKAYDAGVVKVKMTWGEALDAIKQSGETGLFIGALLGGVGHVAGAGKVEQTAEAPPSVETPPGGKPPGAPPAGPAARIEPTFTPKPTVPDEVANPPLPPRADLTPIHDPKTWAQTGWQDAQGNVLPLDAPAVEPAPVAEKPQKSETVAEAPAQPDQTAAIIADQPSPAGEALAREFPKVPPKVAAEPPESAAISPGNDEKPIDIDMAKAALASNIDPATALRPKGNAALRDFRARMQAVVDQPPGELSNKVSRETEVPAAEPEQAFDPNKHIAAAMALIKDRSQPLTVPALAKKLNLQPEQAARVTSMLASRPDSGVTLGQSGTLRRKPVSTGPEHVAQAVAAMGGIRDDQGHSLIKARGLQQFVPGHGPIIRPTGKSLDQVGQHLWEAGYFGQPEKMQNGPSEAETLDLLEKTAGKTKVFKPEDAAAVDETKAGARATEENDRARQDVTDAAKDLGEHFGPDDIESSIAMMGERGISAEDAVHEHVERLAMRQADDSVKETGDDKFGDIPFDTEAEAAPSGENGRPAGERGEPSEDHAGDRVEKPAGRGDAAEAAAEEDSGRSAEQPAAAGHDAALKTEAGADGLDQTIVPGGEKSAQQLAAAREAEGHGRSRAKAPQKEAGGLFEKSEPETGNLFSRRTEEQKPFYSALTKHIEDLKQERAPAQQWASVIDNARSKGVKQEEIDWSGVKDWLGEQKGAVTKTDLLAHLRENEVQLQEVEKGAVHQQDYSVEYDSDEDGWFRTNERTGERSGPFETEDGATQYGAASGGSTKFSSYTLPGGENYRELLMTMPRPKPEVKQYDIKQEGDHFRVYPKDSDSWVSQHPSEAQARKAIEGNQNREIALDSSKKDYKSGHWDEPNILAHIRFDDRTGPNGEKILHMAEVQSDWHQEGRRKGYNTGEGTKAFEAANAAVKELRPKVQDMVDRHDLFGFDTAGEARAAIAKEPDNWEYDTPEDKALAHEWSEKLKKSRALATAKEAGVPDAPFKSTWHELALKRMLRYAAEHGYDKLTWDTGSTQEQRYWGNETVAPAVDRWREVTKPDGIGKLAENVFGRKMAAAMPLDVVDGGVLAALHHDQVKRAVIAALPVDVVNDLASVKVSPEQFFRNPDMAVADLSANHLRRVANGVLDAARKTATLLRAKLEGLQTARANPDLLPALRASDLSAREVAGLLDPERLFHRDSGGAPEGAAATGAGAELTRPVRTKLGSTALADALNNHAAILHGDGGLLQHGFQTPPGEGQRGFYDKIVPNFLNKYGKKWGARASFVGEKNGAGKVGPDVSAIREIAGLPTNPMDRAVIAAAHNDKVAKAVVGRLGVDVVDLLAANGLRPEDAVRDPSMLADRFSGDDRVTVALGIRNALAKTGADLRAGLDSSFKAGLDKEILPALHASDLGTDVAAGILSAKGDHVGGSAGATDIGMGAGGTGARAEARVPGGALDRGEISAAKIADFKQWHESLSPKGDLNVPHWETDITPAMKEGVMGGQPMFQKPFGKRAPGEISKVSADMRFTDAFKAQREEIGAALRDRLDKMGLDDVALKVPDWIKAKEEGQPDFNVDGVYSPLRKLIGVSIETQHGHEHTLDHESIHAMRDLGVFTGSEWKILENKAKGWVDKYNIRKNYEGSTEEKMLEEGVAHAYPDWVRGKLGNAGNAVARIFRKMSNVLEATRNALKGLGFKSADDIFKGVQSGEIGARGGDGTLAASEGPSFSKRETEEEEPKPKPGIMRAITKPLDDLLGPKTEKFGEQINKAAASIVPESVIQAKDALKMAVAPMATGTPEARAAAKDFANGMRMARMIAGRQQDYLKNHFEPDQLQRMWEAADEQSVLMQQDKKVGPDEGLNRLAPDERAAVEAFQADSRSAAKEAIEVGILKSELPSYVPRMGVAIGSDGEIGRLGFGGEGASGLDAIGRNLRTSTPNAKQRKYLTADETEAAMKGLSPDAVLVKDFRTLVLSAARLREAVSGRKLINQIKEIGKNSGEVTVSEGADPGEVSGHKYFTIDHPSFKTYRPKLVENPETGKWETLNDEGGNPIFERVPLFVRDDFEGPLKAVLSKKTGAIYKAFMDIKGKSMSVIMYSPLMHNAVIWGKAFPAAPKKLLTPWYHGADGKLRPGLQLYGEGRVAKNDPVVMKEAVGNGLDPIGHRYFNQDITGMLEQDNLKPGRSWTAQVMGAIPNLFSKDAGDAVKRAIDKAGDVWHNKFLWDLVGDLQMGLYTHIRDGAIKDGHDPQTAGRLAAHFANRYAGALPIESMSRAARMTSNFLMFSRSFTLTNVGAFKDLVRGLPQDVQSQILRDRGIEALNNIQGTARRKAATMLAMDIFLSHVGNFMAQYALAYYMGRQFVPPSENEPDKENRFLISYQKDGTGVYGRLPVGKVGEDLQDWITEPADIGNRKMSMYGRLIYGLAANDAGFNKQIYDKHDHGMAGYVRNIGRIAEFAANTLLPLSAFDGMKSMVKNKGEQKTNLMKTLLPLAGITVSKGAPGGPSMGQLYDTKEENEFQIGEAMPDIREKIAKGDLQGASKDMSALGIDRSRQRYIIRGVENPASRMTKSQMKRFLRTAPPEDQERMKVLQKQQQDNRAKDQHSALEPGDLKGALSDGSLEKFAASGQTWSRQQAIRAASAAGMPATTAILREAQDPLSPNLQKLASSYGVG